MSEPGETVLIAEAIHDSDKASSYIARLCKHFAHKVPATYDETSGRADFGIGVAEMTATDTRLTMRITAPTADGLTKCKAIIEDHLVRFAFRENLKELSWNNEAMPCRPVVQAAGGNSQPTE